MKKVLSFVLVLSLVLGSFGMAFATTPSDVVGAKSETAVSVLVNMGIINGYTDGTYKPEGIVTRAEMAKILVTALGLGKMVPSTTSSFTDMAGHWANGYVAYAASLGIVAGYPDGTFKPDATVSYEEAATMMVRSLGYDDRALVGTWPGNYVSKALALGLYKNVAAAAGGANRGDIALMVYELLDEAMGKVSDDGHVFTANGDTMLKINSAYLDTDDDNAAEPADSTDPGFAITPAHNTSDKSLIDLTAYLGQKVYVYKNKDNKIISIAKVKSDVLTGTFDFNSATDMEIEVNGKAYDFITTGFKDLGAANVAADPIVIVNGDKEFYLVNDNPAGGAAALATQKNVATLNEMNITVNGDIDGTKITPDSITVWIPDASQLATTGDLYDIEDVLDGSASNLFGYNLIKDDNNKVDFSKFTVVGTATKLADIKKDDVIDVYTNDDGKVVRIRVSNKIEEGKVTKNDGTKVTINGNEYKVSGAVVGGLTAADPKLVAGTTVKAWIGGNGRIVKVDEVKAASADKYAMVITPYNGISNTATGFSLKVLTKDGEMVTLKVNTDADYKANPLAAATPLLSDGGVTPGVITRTAATALTVIPGSIITYKTDSTGNIKELTMEASRTGLGDGTYNSRTNKLDVDGAGYQNIASNVVVFKFVSGTPKDSKVIKLADIKDSTATANGTIDGAATDETIKVYDATDNEVVAIAVDSTGVASTNKYATVQATYDVYSEVDDDTEQQLDVLTADGLNSYMFEDGVTKAVVKGDLVDISLTSGRLNNSTAVVATKGAIEAARGTITDVTPEINEIEVGATTYEYYAETIFYVATFTADNVFDGWKLGTASDARINAEVVAYDLNQDGEDYVDDSAANICEVVFIVKSGDVSKTL